MAFRIIDTALEGFRLTRAHPKAVALWGGLCLLMNLVTVGSLVIIAGPAIAEMTDMSATGAAASDPTTAIHLLGRMMIAYAVMIPLTLVIMAVLVNAILRASAFPERGAFGYVRLGADEFRLAVVYLVLGILSFIGAVALMIPLSVITGMMMVAGGSTGMMAGTLILYAILFFAWMLWYTKMSFAAPMTLVQGRINIFGSWNATNGRFWALFGCNLLASLLAAVVMALGVVIGLAAMVGFGGAIDSAFKPDMTSMATYFTPGMTAYFVVAGLFWAMSYVIFFAPSMSAYKTIHGLGAHDVSRTFD